MRTEQELELSRIGYGTIQTIFALMHYAEDTQQYHLRESLSRLVCDAGEHVIIPNPERKKQ